MNNHTTGPKPLTQWTSKPNDTKPDIKFDGAPLQNSSSKKRENVLLHHLVPVPPLSNTHSKTPEIVVKRGGNKNDKRNLDSVRGRSPPRPGHGAEASDLPAAFLAARVFLGEPLPQPGREGLWATAVAKQLTEHPPPLYSEPMGTCGVRLAGGKGLLPLTNCELAYIHPPALANSVIPVPRKPLSPTFPFSRLPLPLPLALAFPSLSKAGSVQESPSKDN